MMVFAAVGDSAAHPALETPIVRGALEPFEAVPWFWGGGHTRPVEGNTQVSDAYESGRKGASVWLVLPVPLRS